MAEGRRIVGYPALFDDPAEIGGRFREQVAKGAFKRTIEESDIRALVDHDPSRILGRARAGTLRLSEDGRGLHIEIDPPDTQAGRDIKVSLERGDVSGMSFGFQARQQAWEDEASAMPLRTLLEVELFDVSIVTFPAYANTEVALRSLEAARGHRRIFNAAARRLRLTLDLDLRSGVRRRCSAGSQIQEMRE